MIRRTCLLAVVVAVLTSLAVPAGAAEPAAESAAEPLEHLQWGLNQVRAPEAWSVTRGAGATVAVVDSGVDLGHPEFAGRIVGGATFVGCPEAPDGCGDGDLRSGDDPEPSVHGTHVAGIAGAADDGGGITGVAPEALLLAVKVLAGDGDGNTTGTASDIAAGIRWATRNGADVISLSLSVPLPGGGQALAVLGAFEPLEAAIREATAAGVVVVAAAGNESAPLCDEPAFNPQVVCVVATDRFEDPAVYSNHAVNQGLHVVAAPGGAAVFACADDVLSAFPVGTEDTLCPTVPSGYGYLAGTSMAAPHVAGVAALLVAHGLTADLTVDRLLVTARNPVTGQRGAYDPVYGYGIVDAQLAVGDRPAAVVTRHEGSDRVATSVAVSRQSYPAGADAVVIARADAYADALAGAPLASLHRAPLLLSHRSRLSASTADEVTRLGAETAYLLGGEMALSSSVAEALRDQGVR
ncbi:MAG TPA: S8 family serine peptidase, partial [Nitriliruptorales bacterium]